MYDVLLNQNETVSFPPTQVVDPDGTVWEVTDTQGFGSVLYLEQNEETTSIDWLTVSDPETDWDYVEG